MGECCDLDPATSLGTSKDKNGRKVDWGPGLFSLENSNKSYWGKWFLCIWTIEILAWGFYSFPLDNITLKEQFHIYYLIWSLQHLCNIGQDKILILFERWNNRLGSILGQFYVFENINIFCIKILCIYTYVPWLCLSRKFGSNNILIAMNTPRVHIMVS